MQHLPTQWQDVHDRTYWRFCFLPEHLYLYGFSRGLVDWAIRAPSPDVVHNLRNRWSRLLNAITASLDGHKSGSCSEDAAGQEVSDAELEVGHSVDMLSCQRLCLG